MPKFVFAFLFLLISTTTQATEVVQTLKSCPLIVGTKLINVAYILDVENNGYQDICVHYVQGNKSTCIRVINQEIEKKKILQAMVECQAK